MCYSFAMNTNRDTTNSVTYDTNLSGHEMTMTNHTRPLWADLPHSKAVVEMLDALRTLTYGEASDMGTAWDATLEAAWVTAWDATLDAARDAVRDTAWVTAWYAAWGVARATAKDAAWYAVQDAVLVLAVADLVGQHGLTREHLDTLTAPACVVPRLAEIIDRALPSDGERA